MGKIAVFIFEGMADYEITFAMHLLSADAGKDILTISYSGECIKGRSKFTYKPDKALNDIDYKEIEALIIPGGWLNDIRPELLALIKVLNERINSLEHTIAEKKQELSNLKTEVGVI